MKVSMLVDLAVALYISSYSYVFYVFNKHQFIFMRQIPVKLELCLLYCNKILFVDSLIF